MSTSPRVAAALEHAGARRSQERRALRRLSVPLLLVVVLPGLTTRPAASSHGAGLAIALALVALVGAFLVIRTSAEGLERGEASAAPTVTALVVLAAAGVVLDVAQPRGTGSLALALVAYVAGSRLAVGPGIVLVGIAAIANAVALGARASNPVTAITSSSLLAVLLFLMARLYRRAQADRERAELATAQLEDARERELASAALAERSRIARELHDVLAHSLSGLSLQLEGARLLAERANAGEELQGTLARCRRLAAEGLADARRAVGALRGDALPGLDDLPRLVDDFRAGGLDVEMQVRGTPRAVSGDTGLAVYRAAQEALTNVVRHSGAAGAQLELEYGDGTVRLLVLDDGAGGGAAVLAGVGGGYGLSAMRERAELLGGNISAGWADAGFRVELELPG